MIYIKIDGDEYIAIRVIIEDEAGINGILDELNKMNPEYVTEEEYDRATDGAEFLFIDVKDNNNRVVAELIIENI